MTRAFLVIVFAFTSVFYNSSHVAAQGVEGSWKVTYVAQGAVENVYAIVALGGEGKLVAATPRLKELSLKGVTQVGNTLRIALQSGGVDLVFEAAVPKEAAKKLNGTMSVDGNLFPAWISMTDETTLDAKIRLVDCPPIQQARSLAARATTLQFQAQQSKDPEKRKDLLMQAAEAAQKAKKESPGLYREVIAKHADSPSVFEASLALMRTAQSTEAKPDEVKSWADAGESAAKAYGMRWQSEYVAQVATILAGQEGFAPMAVEFAQKAEKSLTPQTAAGEQVRVLNVLARALRKAGKDDDAKAVDARVSKFDEILDREYSAKMPPFKGTAFEGRKSKSDRAVLMELFTGATCPPCVAADLAFDVLQKTYKPTELVLLQYHMHIPGPDPMTNPDTETRWSYYQKAFPTAVRGVPSSIFNGQPKAGGGGGVANAKPKYDTYRGLVEELLEDNAGAKLNVEAERVGERINIAVKVSDVADPGEKKKLRILIAEETVRYAGSNKIRLHHNVVRAFPGGVAGTKLMEPASRHKASIDIGELRGNLTKYLDDFQLKRPFLNPARPMEMSHLRAIVFVQDDANQEILQAAMVEVKVK